MHEILTDGHRDSYSLCELKLNHLVQHTHTTARNVTRGRFYTQVHIRDLSETCSYGGRKPDRSSWNDSSATESGECTVGNTSNFVETSAVSGDGV